MQSRHAETALAFNNARGLVPKNQTKTQHAAGPEPPQNRPGIGASSKCNFISDSSYELSKSVKAWNDPRCFVNNIIASTR